MAKTVAYPFAGMFGMKRLTTRIAIALWQLRISPVFDTTGNLLLLDVNNGREVYRTEHSLHGLSIQKRVDKLVELDVDVLICGAISRPLADMVRASGIRIIPWMKGNVNDVLTWYLTGTPVEPRFLMPGRRHRRHRFRGQRRGGAFDHRENYPEDYL
jgi:predicted Fe-Mo cluster-binding NifX family protein